jgi:hypothetical protein
MENNSTRWKEMLFEITFRLMEISDVFSHGMDFFVNLEFSLFLI